MLIIKNHCPKSLSQYKKFNPTNARSKRGAHSLLLLLLHLLPSLLACSYSHDDGGGKTEAARLFPSLIPKQHSNPSTIRPQMARSYNY